MFCFLFCLFFSKASICSQGPLLNSSSVQAVSWTLRVFLFSDISDISDNFTAIDECNERDRKALSYPISWKCCKDKPVNVLRYSHITIMRDLYKPTLLFLQLFLENVLMWILLQACLYHKVTNPCCWGASTRVLCLPVHLNKAGQRWKGVKELLCLLIILLSAKAQRWILPALSDLPFQSFLLIEENFFHFCIFCINHRLRKCSIYQVLYVWIYNLWLKAMVVQAAHVDGVHLIKCRHLGLYSIFHSLGAWCYLRGHKVRWS